MLSWHFIIRISSMVIARLFLYHTPFQKNCLKTQVKSLFIGKTSPKSPDRISFVDKQIVSCQSLFARLVIQFGQQQFLALQTFLAIYLLKLYLTRDNNVRHPEDIHTLFRFYFSVYEKCKRNMKIRNCLVVVKAV